MKKLNVSKKNSKRKNSRSSSKWKCLRSWATSRNISTPSSTPPNSNDRAPTDSLPTLTQTQDRLSSITMKRCFLTLAPSPKRQRKTRLEKARRSTQPRVWDSMSGAHMRTHMSHPWELRPTSFPSMRKLCWDPRGKWERSWKWRLRRVLRWRGRP